MENLLSFNLKPKNLDDYIGQNHLLSKDGPIYNMIVKNKLFNIIFYGPSGVGKSSLAKVIVESLKLPYREFNAAIDNKKKLENYFIEATLTKNLIIIIDEFHRLNKDKQDLLLPYLENGLITIIGTTTSNPYHSINPAIRSRVFMFELFPLTDVEIKNAILKICHKQGYEIEIEALNKLSSGVNGDLRYAYNILELLFINDDKLIKLTDLDKCFKPKIINFKDGDEYYDLLSAFQKSIRGSDVNAALYYLARMLLNNDLEIIERRLLTIAYEDIGLASPEIVSRTIAAIDTAKRIGMPEAMIPLGLQVIDLTLAPKSKSSYLAIKKAYQTALEKPHNIPSYLKLSNFTLKDEEKYDYNNLTSLHKIQYLPNEIKNIEFYTPSKNKYESTLNDLYLKLKNIKRTNDLTKINKG